jgi:manganese/zinc/iron transport system permease protein
VADNWLYILTDPNLLMVIAGTMLIGITAGVVGSFTLLQRKALIGDGIAHAILPGVILAYMVTGDKDPWVLFLGSVIAGWISLWCMDLITRKTTLTADTAVGVILSVFFGIGVMLLGIVQAQESGNQSGLDKFLFGQAASLMPGDVIFLSIVCILVLFTVRFSFKELRVRTFDPQFARSLGYDRPIIRYIETALLVVVLTTGLQAVGVILMAAVLIIPAATARYWTDRLSTMLIISGVFGASAAVIGSLISYMAPRMPTGPWMVVAASILLFISMIFAPNYGALSRFYRQRAQSRRIDEDHLVKTMWMMRENNFDKPGFTLAQIAEWRPTAPTKLEATLQRLVIRGWIKRLEDHPGHWRLAKLGRDEARRLVRVHRLWETYLTELLAIADDHVHEDADSMEHIITPEIEAQLAIKLGYPEADPHKSRIPYGTEDEA